jgi:hypothetical protein
MVLTLALLSSLAADAPATTVYVGSHIVQMRNIDPRAESFYADFYLWLRFKGADEDRAKQITDKLEVVNGKFESKEEVDRKKVGDEDYVCYRITGTFFFKQDLRKYPFDTQALEVILENSNLENFEMVFADDKNSYVRSGEAERFWGVNPALSIPEFHLDRVDRAVSEGVYRTDFGDPSRPKSESLYSRFTIRVLFMRDYWSYLFKIVIPLLIILGMAYLVFFIPASQLDTAGSVAVTALLSCMAYNVAVAQNMPEIGYMVLSDKFFIATYLLLFFTLAETFGTFVLDDRGEKEKADRIEKVARIAYPLTVFGIFGWLITSGTM